MPVHPRSSRLSFRFSRTLWTSTCIDMYHLADWMTSSRSAIEHNDILVQFRTVRFTSPLARHPIPSPHPLSLLFFHARDKSHQSSTSLRWLAIDRPSQLNYAHSNRSYDSSSCLIKANLRDAILINDIVLISYFFKNFVVRQHTLEDKHLIFENF